MQIFNKEIKIKDYDCSFNPEIFPKRQPIINLYVQSQQKCNAKCDFCNFGSVDRNFNFEKFKEILKELSDKNLIKRISITGGEPLLDIDRILKIAEISKKFRIKTVLNTNAYNLEKLAIIYPYVDEIFVSKHHYDNDKNNRIMQIKTPTIKQLSDFDKDKKIIINCVMQKEYIDNEKEIKNFLEYLGTTNISKIKFISLYPLTKNAVNKMFDINKLIEYFEDNQTNAGILYDKNYCCCLDFIYITEKGKVIQAIINNNKTNHYTCCKQLVFNGENLFDGFEKNIIIY